MHRAFITERDYLVYEDRERARQRMNDERAEGMDVLAHESRKPYPKSAPDVMDVDELSEGPNLPHRDDKDISTRSRDAAWKAGYYRAGIDAFTSDAYMDKPSPIDRKASARNTRRMSDGTAYALTHGGGEPGQWGRPLTATNKHLSYWRDPTSREALANLAGHGPDHATPGNYFTLEIPREFLVMLARVHDIQAKRGKIEDRGQGDTLRETAQRVTEGTVTVSLYSPSDVLTMSEGLPKRYRTGQFGQLMKDLATHAKLNK